MKNTEKAQNSGEQHAAAEWVEVESLKPWAKNPRRNEKAIKRVADSIKRFGFGAPLLARREDGEIIAGHTRLKAAISLGVKRVPVRYLDLDPADAHLLALADNKLGEIAEWDNDQLAEVLGPLYMQRDELADVAGFSDEEIGKLLKVAGDEIMEAADESDKVKTDFVVLVECTDEDHQRDIIDQLIKMGLSCRALI